MPHDALLVVDVQNDFCPGGALPVPSGDVIVPVLNAYINFFQRLGLPIFASRDWHPAVSRHFQPFGGPWPIHCIQATPGAEFHPQLRLPKEAIIISKGVEPDQHGYSVFEGTDPQGRPFIQVLRELGVERLFIGGLATDYCVRHSALDALRHGFAVWLLADASRGVDLQPGDSERAIAEIRRQGGKVATFAEVLATLGQRAQVPSGV
ncbi:MAG: nicotinamidase [Dehalococcoidia bacterium]|nr:nicotinamidase [Dehalococcoidia bacterium]MDW8119569.1 nicotinamidase [Chloroflexota bacterium]